MDHAAALSTEVATCSAEQAVFTSIRSPMGEGYRIVAASSGVTPHEKKELVQRCPSHGSLCDEAEDACALSSYRLRSGRHCVALSSYAGVEHTARGGQRVYTQIVIFEAEDFARFACNPFSVMAEVQRVFNGPPVLKEDMRLKPVELTAGGSWDSLDCPQSDEADRVIYVLSALVSGERLAVFGSSLQSLDHAWQAMPLVRRARVSLSVGLKASPSRDYDLLAVDSDADRRRLQSAADRVAYDWSEAPPPQSSAYDAWLGYVRRLWGSNRASDVAHIASRLTSSESHAIDQFVSLCNDFERVPLSGHEMLDVLSARHRRNHMTMQIHSDLLEQFHQAVDDRRAMLEAETEARKQAAGEAPEASSAEEA